MWTVSISMALAWALTCLATGFFIGAYVYRRAHDRVMSVFNRYRAAMLDDWRDASDKVLRLRNLIMKGRTVAEIRAGLRQDDFDHPALPIGAPTVRSPGPSDSP